MRVNVGHSSYDRNQTDNSPDTTFVVMWLHICLVCKWYANKLIASSANLHHAL